jgi:2,4-dienoyl-CoA reductase-like NADH-dependent reductase (Old Yellow Enzyme family)
MIDRRALGEPRNVVVEDERDAERLSEWAHAARAGGAQVWAQLNHPGRQVPRILSRQPVAPSEVPMSSGAFAAPRALAAAEIAEIVQRFASTADIMVRSGFTGIQIHAAHGYLASQFLSPLTNRRTDEWGGDPVRRRRFLLEIIRAVRARIGTGVPLSVKLNSADFQRGGLAEDESLEVAAVLADEGIDLLEISGGTYEAPALMGTRQSTRDREAYFLDYATRVRARVRVPLMLTGGFRTVAGMTNAVGSDAIDVVGLGRPMALEPDLPLRLLTGIAQASNVRPRRVGIRSLDAASELVWYTTQLWRMGRGNDPDPRQHPVLGLLRYSAATGVGALRRSRRGHA